MSNQPGSSPDPSTAKTLIMKGGGVKGLAFAGAIEVLVEEGFHFDTFVGTSAGSVGAVLLAAGYSPAQLQTVLREQSFAEFLDATFPARIWNFVTRGGMYPGRKLQLWVERLLRQRFDETRYPLIQMKSCEEVYGKRAIVFASHPRTGTLTFDSSGTYRDAQVSHAVRLSSSIPGFFIPERHDGHRIYDGGLLHNFPIEVYQRIRRSTDGPDADDEDFLALYIGRPSGQQPHEKWWLREVFDIVLARDDTIQLQTHHSRSLILDTAPIGTTDFALDDSEKDLLVTVGREAALRFVGKIAEADETQGRVNELRAIIVDRRARRRKIRSATRIAAALLFMVAAILGARTVRQWIPERYTAIEDPKFRSAFVNDRNEVTGIGTKAVDDLKDMFDYYGPTFAEGCSWFDSVVQVVLIDGELATDATKIVLFEGTVKGQYGRMLKVTASTIDGTPTADGFVFIGKDGDWIGMDQERWESAGAPSGKVQRRLKISDYYPDGTPVRFVMIATYQDVFYEATIPWLLTAHRFLHPEGNATYAFLRPPGDKLSVPSRIFVEDEDRYALLQTPKLSVNSEKTWDRVDSKLAFLRDESVQNHIQDPALQTALQRTLQGVEAGIQKFKVDGLTDVNLTFSFDNDETRRLPMPYNKCNAVVFVRNKSVNAAGGTDESSASDTSPEPLED